MTYDLPTQAAAPSGVQHVWMAKRLAELDLIELASLRCALMAGTCPDYALLRAVDDQLECRAEESR
ncbi:MULTISPECIES: hypothetical protein [Thermomonosporaceae]|uniref:hypothetical protein n=1 Tax=Thermomonosporaceae TaxID=2012 RepID=UPI00255AA520|nr:MULTISPECIES: hypothetical protein [Thermomonosporaceae]MDL4773205.1 hypothetical protein [Actinomadura xylanilytica]